MKSKTLRRNQNREDLSMVADKTLHELKNKTGLDVFIEDELISRIKEIEGQEFVVVPLTTIDWVISAFLFLFVGIVPVIYYASILPN